jgi:excisionase family DNA binding protein
LCVEIIGVAEAARRLGVGVPRIHQRIADGSLSAERVGSQWVIDETSLPSAQESCIPGRPLSQRSAWALVAVSQADRRALEALAPSERSRAKSRFLQLSTHSVADVALSEDQIHALAALLRAWLRNRAERHLYRASPIDLPDLRADGRLTISGVSHPVSGFAAGDLVEGYVDPDDVGAVVDAYLLSPVTAGDQGNVVLHVVPKALAGSVDDIAPLLLAADLAEHRGPREEARAAELVREVASRAAA